jgi:hypothetical protein
MSGLLVTGGNHCDVGKPAGAIYVLPLTFQTVRDLKVPSFMPSPVTGRGWSGLRRGQRCANL